MWRELTGVYMPWLKLDEIPFYGDGKAWQRQTHIYASPFYYIDYCLAQTVAFQFWIESMKDRSAAWEKYLRFVDAGGTKTFQGLVEAAGLKVPYADGVISEIGEAISKWIEANPL